MTLMLEEAPKVDSPDLTATPREQSRRPRPRVAFFSESILPWVDGVSKTLGQLFDALEAAGRDFRIYAPITPSNQYGWSHRVRRVRSLSFPLYSDYRVSMPHFDRLRADLDAFAPDVVHVSSPTPAAVWAQSYARERGIPVVGGFHTHFASYMRHYGLGLLKEPVWHGLTWFYNRCDVTLAPSTSMIRELQLRRVRNVRLWGRGIDCDLYTPLRRDAWLRTEIGIGRDTPVLLLVSRLVKEKDLRDLIAMDAVLRSRRLRYQLVFVGEGPLRQELEDRLPDAIFTGQQVGAELARWYASADVFVFPSTTETFGNVVQEAMASGLPAVVVDKGGPAGVIEPSLCGLVARSNDPADLAAKVEQLLLDEGLRRRMGENGRRLAERRSWQEVNDSVLREYDLLMEEHHRVAQGGRVQFQGLQA